MAFLSSNRLGNIVRGMGTVSKTIYKGGKYGLDKALSSQATMYGTMAGAGALYTWDRSKSSGSNSRGSNFLGKAALAVGATVGIAGASRGLMGMTAKSYTGMAGNSIKGIAEHGLDVGIGLSSMAGSRFRRY